MEVWFSNPIDGGSSVDPTTHRAPLWSRTGKDFDELSLMPSIKVMERDPETRKVIVNHWHGFLQNGMLLFCL